MESILAGIIVNTGLYSINLAVMGFKSNVAVFGTDTLFSLIKGLIPGAFWAEWYKLITVTVIVLIACFLIWWFLGTRLGLSIRATGDSPAMVRASSINTGFTIVVGMCVANAFTGLAGALTAQYDKSVDITRGTGMVTVALASVIIGGIFYNKGNMLKKIIFVVIGSCIYRFIVSLALRLNVPTEFFKLVSALIVAVAIAAPSAKKMLKLKGQKRKARKNRLALANGIGEENSTAANEKED